MQVIPFVHEGLGNSSYLLELENRSAALVDPDRSVQRYLDAAEARGLRIETVFETHLHADFVTGSRDIANATGARIFAAEAGRVAFPHRPLRPGDEVPLEGAAVQAIASPGHTPEHLSYVLRAGRHPPVLFSGGALIVGGAARTDLISPDLTERLTRDLHRTLREAFAALPDETSLCPTHGGGSFCSTGAGGERISTLGRERQTNPVLRFLDEEEFLRWFPGTFPGVPDYFFRMRAVNQSGPRLREDIPPPPALSPSRFQRAAADALVVDVRPVREYHRAHIPGSLSIPFRISFATWLGWLVPLNTPLLFITGPALREAVPEEALLIGHENFAGWLEGGIDAWREAGQQLASTRVVDPQEAREMLAEGAVALDVREPDEYSSGHIGEALHVPLGGLQKELERVPADRPVLTYCGVGERSTTAASILERAGVQSVLNLGGGFAAWQKAGERVTA